MRAENKEVLSKIENNPDLVVGKKFNGFSETLVIEDGEIRVFNKSGTEQTYNIPHITGIVVPRTADLIIQCEGIAPSDKIEDAKSIFGSGFEHAIDWQCRNGFAKMIVMNILRYKGENLITRPFGERLEMLTEAVAYLRQLGMSQLYQEKLQTTGKLDLFNYITEVENGEGVVVKSLSGFERDWFKVKKIRSWDAVIIGFTEGQGKYSNTIGAIVYGFYKDGCYTETGKCSGMTDAERHMFSSFPDSFVGSVIEIQGQELGNQGRIVYPRFIRLRQDKLPENCTLGED